MELDDCGSEVCFDAVLSGYRDLSQLGLSQFIHDLLHREKRRDRSPRSRLALLALFDAGNEGDDVAASSQEGRTPWPNPPPPNTASPGRRVRKRRDAVVMRMGVAEVKITSSYDATQLLFNGDSTEFLEFTESLILQQTPIKSITSNSAYSHVKHFPELFNTYCPGLLDDNDDCLSSKLQLTDNGSYSDEGFFSEEEAKSPNVNAMKEPSVHVTENETVKRSLLDQFSSTQTSKKKKHVVVKEEKELDDKNMNGCLFCDS
nr:replication factor A protein 1-like [Ipomoea batatas]